MAGMNKNEKNDRDLLVYYRKANVGRLLSYFIPHLPLIVVAVVIAFLINAAVLLRPDIFRRIIDDYLIPGNFDKSAVNRLDFITCPHFGRRFIVTFSTFC